MVRHKKEDSYYYKAKTEGYLARSVYKLKDIDKKYKIIPVNCSGLGGVMLLPRAVQGAQGVASGACQKSSTHWPRSPPPSRSSLHHSSES